MILTLLLVLYRLYATALSIGLGRMGLRSSVGHAPLVGDSAGRMGHAYAFVVIPFVLPFYFWDKTRQERLIAASGVNWVIVRPGALTDGVRRHRYAQGSLVDSFVRTVRISRADVAEFMLNQLTDNTYLRTAAGICWSR